MGESTPRLGDPRLKSMDEFTAGDPLRALGMLSVIVTHLGAAVLAAEGTPAAGRALPPVLDATFGSASEALLLSGGVGLSIFFCLSGYLIGRPFVRAYLAGKAMPALGPYAANRLLRIVPALWLAATVFIVLFNRTGESLDGVVSVYGFAQTYVSDPGPLARDLGQVWSVDVELTFYAALPVFALGLSRLTPRASGLRTRLAVVLTVAAATAAASFYLVWVTPKSSVAIHTLPLVLTAFVPGVALAAIEPLAVPLLRGKRYVPWLAAAVFAAGLITFVVLADSADYVGHPEAFSKVRRLLETLAVTFGPSLLMLSPLILQWGGLRCPRLLDNGILRWLGSRSYSLYLFHTLPAIAFASQLRHLAADRGGWETLGLAFLAELVILLPIGALSYHFVERYFLSLKRPRRSVSLRPVPAAAKATAG